MAEPRDLPPDDELEPEEDESLADEPDESGELDETGESDESDAADEEFAEAGTRAAPLPDDSRRGRRLLLVLGLLLIVGLALIAGYRFWHASRLKAAVRHAEQGWQLYEDEKYEAALAEYNEALRLDPAAPDSLAERALVRAAAGDLAGAIADCDQALALDPEYADVRYRRGLLRLDQDALDAAVADFDALLKNDPQDAEARLARGVARARQGDLEGARADFDELLKQDPGNEDALYHRAQARRCTGDRAGARADFEAALRLAPEDPAVLNDLAWLLATAPEAELRNGTRAVELAEQALRAAGERTPDLVDTLGAARAEVGRFAEAEQAETEALAGLAAEESELRRDYEARLALYRQGQPYHEPDESSATPSPAPDGSPEPSPSASTPTPGAADQE